MASTKKAPADSDFYGQSHEYVPPTANIPTGSNSADAALLRILSSAAQAYRFVSPGDTVTGVIEKIEVRQTSDFKTRKPVFWDDGRPQEQVVVTVQTDLDETGVGDFEGEDDGLRAIYVKSWGPQVRAFRKGVKGLKRMPMEGDKFTASLIGVSEDKPRVGEDPEKIFAYTVVKG